MVALKQGSVPDVIANKLDHLLILTSGTEQYLITCTNKKYKFLLTTTLTISGFRVREIPAVMHVRATGVSMHSGLKPVLYMFRMTFSILAVWIREKILKMDEDKIHELEKYDE